MNDTPESENARTTDAPARDIRGTLLAGADQTQVERPRGSSLRQGRRVILRHSSTGVYELLRGNEVIQNFCPAFEDITRFMLPEGIQQQVRIHIIPLSDAREIPREETSEDGVELRTIAHPRPSRMTGLSRESVEEMEIELPDVERALNSWQEEAIDSIHRDIERLHDAMAVIANLGRSS